MQVIINSRKAMCTILNNKGICSIIESSRLLLDLIIQCLNVNNGENMSNTIIYIVVTNRILKEYSTLVFNSQ